MISLRQLAALECERRKLKCAASQLQLALKSAKRRRKVIMSKARHLTEEDLAMLLVEKKEKRATIETLVRDLGVILHVK